PAAAPAAAPAGPAFAVHRPLTAAAATPDAAFVAPEAPPAHAVGGPATTAVAGWPPVVGRYQRDAVSRNTPGIMVGSRYTRTSGCVVSPAGRNVIRVCTARYAYSVIVVSPFCCRHGSDRSLPARRAGGCSPDGRPRHGGDGRHGGQVDSRRERGQPGAGRAAAQSLAGDEIAVDRRAAGAGAQLQRGRR